jgi:hypothetical protein
MTVFATRSGRTVRAVLATTAALMLSAASASANPIVNYDISVLGGTGGPFNLPGLGVNGVLQPNGKYLHAGVLNGPANEWSIMYNTTSDPDPIGGASLSSGLTVSNNMADLGGAGNHLIFQITLTLPVAQASLPATFSGNMSMTLSTTAGGQGVVNTVNSPLWMGMINGATAASLYPNGFFLNAGPQSNASTAPGQNTGLFPYNNPINTIGISFLFELTPGDTMTFTDNFAFIPGPGAMGVLMLGGIGGVSRRRRA